MNAQYKRLGNILLENDLLSQTELDEALRIQMEEKKRLGEVLINKGYVTELDILRVLEKQLNIEYVKISELDITPEIPNLITEKIARRYELLPIKLDGSVLTIAMTDPINFFAREDIGLITGYEIQPVMSLRHEVVNAIDKFYNTSVSEELYEELNETLVL